MRKFLASPRTVIAVVVAGIALFSNSALAQTTTDSPIMDVNPFLNILALALVIERLLEIILIIIPGIEETKNRLRDDPDDLKKFQLMIQRYTLIAGMVLGNIFCIVFKFGILDEIFPEQMSAANTLNHIITGLIAGSGSEPVHQMILIILGIKERLRAGSK